MAPRNDRIVTLKDIVSYGSSMSSSATPRIGISNTSTSLRTNDSSSTNKSKRGSHELSHPLNMDYCPPTTNTKQGGGIIPKLCPIPNLPLSDVCAQTLRQIQHEFDPIIRQRGYNVLSVSEMCCCGDGLDYDEDEEDDYNDNNNHGPLRNKRRRKRRKLRKQSSNVWGYNATRFWGGRSKSHTIHLRLRDPHHHDRLLPWEDVAGTMAHELAHCVHQNHGPEFFKLMEDLLEQHAVQQAHAWSGSMTFTPLNAHVIRRPIQTNDSNQINATATTTVQTHPTTVMPTTGGQRLGGGRTNGKSRLLLTNGPPLAATVTVDVGGQKLGGNLQQQGSLREVMAKAAEARQRQIAHVRRMIERSKEPCIIELLDDDDDGDDEYFDGSDGIDPTPKQTVKEVNVDSTQVSVKPETSSLRKQTFTIDSNSPPTLKSSDSSKRSGAVATAKHRSDETMGTLIDLTDDTDPSGTVPTPQPFSLMQWSCSLCTFLNRPMALACSMCQTERK